MSGNVTARPERRRGVGVRTVLAASVVAAASALLAACVPAPPRPPAPATAPAPAPAPAPATVEIEGPTSLLAGSVPGYRAFLVTPGVGRVEVSHRAVWSTTDGDVLRFEPGATGPTDPLAVSEGVAEVRAAVDGVTGALTVTVTGNLVLLTVSSGNPLVVPTGGARPWYVFGQFVHPGGTSELDVTRWGDWTTGDAAVASPARRGDRVVAVAAPGAGVGSAAFTSATVRLGDQEATRSVVVIPMAIAVDPTPAVLELGWSGLIPAWGDWGDLGEVSDLLEGTSSDPQVVAVRPTQDGLALEAVGLGTALVTVDWGTGSRQTLVEVVEPSACPDGMALVC